MKKYLSGLDKGVSKTTETEYHPASLDQDAPKEKKEKEDPSPDEIRTRSFHVIPAESAHPTDILQQGQRFQLQWRFDPPSNLIARGQQMNYKISICRKKTIQRAP